MAAAVTMAAVFGEAQPDDDREEQQRRPFLFRADAQGHLRVVATDLHSLAWHRSLALADIHDLQDDVGIAGSLSDFLDYLYSSLSSGHVRILYSSSGSADSAKLMATKAKGLPRITISLDRVAPSSLSNVVAEFSLALYAAYKTKHEQAAAEQEQVRQLKKSLATERERNEVMQKQLEAVSFLDKRKATKPKLVTDQVPSVSSAPPDADQVIVPVQQQTSVVSSSKVPPTKSAKRVVPVPRRTRARGALLQDTEENVELEKLFFLSEAVAAAALGGGSMNSLIMRPALSIKGVFFLRGFLLLFGLTELFAVSSVVALDIDSSLRSRSDIS